MEIIDEIISYVNDQIAFYQSRLSDPRTNNLKFFEFHLHKFEIIKSYFDNLESHPDNTPKPSADFVAIKPDDIKGLPKELLAELSLSESDHAEFEIVNILKQHGGTMSLDHLLIALYKQTNTIYKRKLMTAKLYRMAQKGLLYSVPDKRGTYTISPPSKNAAEQLDLIIENKPEGTDP